MYGVIHASGALEVAIRKNAVARMRENGVIPINWTTVGAELQRNWTLPTGQAWGRVFHDHYHSYGLLMDSSNPLLRMWARSRPSCVARMVRGRVLPARLAEHSTITAPLPYRQGLLPTVRVFVDRVAAEFPKAVLV